MRDGAIALVVRPNRRQDGLDRPAVRVVVAADGTMQTSRDVVDLTTSPGEIVETIDGSAYGIDAATLLRDV
jgi:hypothetical protein